MATGIYQGGIAGHYEAQDIPDEYGFSTGNTRQVFVPDEPGSYQSQDVLDEYGFPTGNTKQVFVPKNPTAVGAPPLKADARVISTLTPVMSNVAGNQDLSPTIEGYTGVFKDASGDNILGRYDQDGNLVSTMKQVGGTQYNYSPSGKLLSQESVGGEGGLFGGIKSLVTSDAVKAIAPMALPYFGETIAAALNVSNAVGTAIAQTAVQVAQGVPLDKALMNVAISTVVQTGSTDIAKEIVSKGTDPAIANAITSVGGSIVQTAAKGGDSSNILENAIGALVGSGVTSLTADELGTVASRAIGAAAGTAAAGGDLTQSLSAGLGSLSRTGTTSTSGTAADTTPLTAEEQTERSLNRLQTQLGSTGYTPPEADITPADRQVLNLINPPVTDTATSQNDAATQQFINAFTNAPDLSANPSVQVASSNNEIALKALEDELTRRTLNNEIVDLGTVGKPVNEDDSLRLGNSLDAQDKNSVYGLGVLTQEDTQKANNDLAEALNEIQQTSTPETSGQKAVAADTPKFDTNEFINAVNSGAGQEFINANNLTLADIEKQAGFSQGQMDYYNLHDAGYVAPAEVAGTDTVTGATGTDTVAGGAGVDTVPGGTAATDNVVITADAPATNVSTTDQQVIDLIKTGATTPATRGVTPAEVTTPAVTTPAVTTPAVTKPATTETPATREEVVVTAEKPAVSTTDQQIIDLINIPATANTAATTTPVTTATTTTTPSTTATTETTPATTATTPATTEVTTPATTENVVVTADTPATNVAAIDPQILDLVKTDTGGTTRSLGETVTKTPETVTVTGKPLVDESNVSPTIVDTSLTPLITGGASLANTAVTTPETVTITADGTNTANTDAQIIDLISGGTGTTTAGTGAATTDTTKKAETDKGTVTVTAGADNAASNAANPLIVSNVDTSKTTPAAKTTDTTTKATIDTKPEVVVTGTTDNNAAGNVTPTIVDMISTPAVTETPVTKEETKKEETAVEEPPVYKPEVFLFGGTPGKRRSSLPGTLRAPFYPSTGLTQALTASRPTGEIETDPTGKKRQNVWNEASLRLKDALGL